MCPAKRKPISCRVAMYPVIISLRRGGTGLSIRGQVPVSGNPSCPIFFEFGGFVTHGGPAKSIILKTGREKLGGAR